MACSHLRRGRDKTVLPCLQTHRQLERSRQDSFVASPIVFTPPKQTHRNWVETRQNCVVGGVNTIGDQTN